jgi:hypothetical protein
LKELLTRCRKSGNDLLGIADSIANAVNAEPHKLFDLKQFFHGKDVRPHEYLLLNEVFTRINFIPDAASYPPKQEFVYRGEALSPVQIIANDGFFRTAGTQSIFMHKQITGTSIYISTTTNLKIALEHACQFPSKFVYRIRATGGICVNSFLAPTEFHAVEEEVVFPYHIPYQQIDAVAYAKNWDTLETKFYPMDQHIKLIHELINKGLVRID